MFSKLDEIEVRFEEVESRLADPDLANRQSEFRSLSQEHARLLEMVTAYRRYKKVDGEIESNKELVSGDDEELANMAKDELRSLSEEKVKLEHELKILLLPRDPNDDKNIILEIRAGAGGDEAGLFAADLFRMYQKYGETQGWRSSVLSMSDTGIGGIKEVVASIEGEKVYSRLKFEAGVHRVQRVPQTETQGRIHTSTVTVAVMPEAEDVDIDINPTDLRIDVYRAGGKGGQGVNTTDSAVRITHNPSGVVVVCQDERSQLKNKNKAMKILRARLLDHEIQKSHKETSDARKAMVGTGDRSERIRTYNFPQGRVTDHRIGLTLHELPNVIDGRIQPILDALRTYYQTEELKAQGMS